MSLRNYGKSNQFFRAVPVFRSKIIIRSNKSVDDLLPREVFSVTREKKTEGKERDGNHIIVHQIVFLLLQIHALKCNQRHSCATV